MKVRTLWSACRSAALALLLLVAPTAALAQTADSGDTAWMLVATALVLFMTLPGLALFYGGLVRTRNVLSVLMQCIALAGIITPLWIIFGYSLAFDTTGMVKDSITLHAFIGGFDKALFLGIGADTLAGSIPEVLFAAFQLTFAIITPCLITGAFVERMKFSSMLVFSTAWVVLVYLPICHMTWSGPGAYFFDIGVLDFAGGSVVHLTAGTAALVACLVVGPRSGHGKVPMTPHSMTLCFVGTAMLWVGWYGFNGGSALAADGGAAMAILVTQVCAATSGVVWMFIEWWRFKRPTLIGIATGAVAGLVAITPASGFVGPLGAIAIGIASGAVCYCAVALLKPRLGYDDSLDVFGVHGVGGLIGSLLTGFFAHQAVGGNMGALPVGKQFLVQLQGCVITAAYTALVTWLLLKLIERAMGLRVSEDDETVGLDITIHGEAGYDY